jgi:hypothetical protein
VHLLVIVQNKEKIKKYIQPVAIDVVAVTLSEVQAIRITQLDVMSDQIYQWSTLPLEKLILSWSRMKVTALYETLCFFGVN